MRHRRLAKEGRRTIVAEQIRTLVVDDEESIRFFLERTLEKVEHGVVVASSGEEALDLLRNTPFELVILDLNLGGRIDGLRVLEAIRWRWQDTAVIILTGHGSLDSALVAIREGVDGYLLKPVEPGELRQAVKEALERRERLSQPAKEEGNLFEYGPFCVDLGMHLATLNGRPLDLTPSEFALLAHLMRNVHRVVPPRELVRVVQGYECEDLYEARQVVKWYIHRLRRKVEPDPSHPCYILNMRGVGYRFIKIENGQSDSKRWAGLNSN
jgi:DNA-binding response OmpR family regulator